jgi:hypothetical protein
MAEIREWAELQKLTLTKAEDELIKACYAGIRCKFSDGELPSLADSQQNDRKVRAGILRYLTCGGCTQRPVLHCSIELVGAAITGRLNLDHQKLQHPLTMLKCRMDEGISAIGAVIPRLVVSDCNVHRLNLDKALVQGDVSLDGTVFSERVCLSGARIKGQLDCEDATFSSSRIPIGQKSAEQSFAFDGQDMRVDQGFFWRDVTVLDGVVDLSLAKVGALADDYESWPAKGSLRLNGFTYEGLARSPKDTTGRLEWLEAGSRVDGEFFPQPYTQLATVMRDIGHEADARTVLQKREKLLKIESRKRIQMDTDPASKNYVIALAGDFGCAFHFIFADKLLQGLIGYGHKPFRSLIALAILITVTTFPAHWAYKEGDFAPNSAVILTSAGWQSALSSPNPATVWSSKGEAGQDWETFNPFIYAADVVVPIIRFGQTDAWAPSTNREPWGRRLWWAESIISLMGWIITALGAAAITGLIRRE